MGANITLGVFEVMLQISELVLFALGGQLEGLHLLSKLFLGILLLLHLNIPLLLSFRKLVLKLFFPGGPLLVSLANVFVDFLEGGYLGVASLELFPQLLLNVTVLEDGGSF